MTFNDIFDRIEEHADTRANVLGDGMTSCSYAAIPEVFGHLRERFEECGVNSQEHITLEVSNTVAGALTLLFVLANRYSFVLLPALSPAAKGERPEIKPPEFCRFQLAVDSGSRGPELPDGASRAGFLRVSENEEFRSGLEVEMQGEPKLYLQTSGTLGAPKLVVHSHKKLLGNVSNCVERFGLKSGSRITIPVPIFHMYGLGAAFLPSVVVGASIDLQENTNLIRYMDRERQFHPDTAFLTPTLCEMFLKGRRSLRRYGLVVTAGDRIKRDTFVEFESRFGPLVNLYGTTEMGAISASSPDDPAEVRASTVGKPMSGVTVKLVGGAESNKGLGSGRLQCLHNYGFDGYVDNKGNWVRSPCHAEANWFDTGDMGRMDEKGYIEVLGRSDHSVNRSGILVFFSDIERQLEAIDGIEKAVVIAKGESKWGGGIAAFCVPIGRASIQCKDIRDKCYELLPRYAIPDNIVVIKSLPTLPSGKVDRSALPTIASSEEDPANQDVL